jgi:hypothetical protein
MNFKRIILSAMLSALLVIGGQFIGINTASAQDVWAGNIDGYEVWVDTDSISGGSNYARTATKYVKNGTLVKRVTWNFSKFKTDSWRYRTSTMGNNTSVVIANDVSHRILEKCAYNLGISLYTKGQYVY